MKLRVYLFLMFAGLLSLVSVFAMSAFPSFVSSSQNITSSNCAYYNNQIKCTSYSSGTFTSYSFELHTDSNFDQNNLTLVFPTGDEMKPSSCSPVDNSQYLQKCTFNDVSLNSNDYFKIEYNNYPITTINVGIDNRGPRFYSNNPLKIYKTTDDAFNFTFVSADDFTYVKKIKVIFVISGNHLAFTPELIRHGNNYYFSIPKSSLGKVNGKVNYELDVFDVLGNKGQTQGQIMLDTTKPSFASVNLYYEGMKGSNITFPQSSSPVNAPFTFVFYSDKKLSSVSATYSTTNNEKGKLSFQSCGQVGNEYRCISSFSLNDFKSSFSITFNINITDTFKNAYSTSYSFSINVGQMTYSLTNVSSNLPVLYLPGFINGESYIFTSKNGQIVKLYYSNYQSLKGLFLTHSSTHSYYKNPSSKYFSATLYNAHYKASVQDIFGKKHDADNFTVVPSGSSVRFNGRYISVMPKINNYNVTGVFNSELKSTVTKDTQTLEITAGSRVSVVLNISGLLLDPNSVNIDATYFNKGTSFWPLSCQKVSVGDNLCTVTFPVDRNEHKTGKITVSFKDLFGKTHKVILGNFDLKFNSKLPPTSSFTISDVQGVPKIYDVDATYASGLLSQQVFLLFNLSREPSFNIYAQKINYCIASPTNDNDDLRQIMSLGTPQFIYTPLTFKTKQNSLRNGIGVPVTIQAGSLVNPFRLTCNVSFYVSDEKAVYTKPLNVMLSSEFQVSFSEDDLNNLYDKINRTWNDVKNPSYDWVVRVYDLAKVASEIDKILMGTDALLNDICWLSFAGQSTPVIGTFITPVYQFSKGAAQMVNSFWQSIYHPYIGFWGSALIESHGVPQLISDIQRGKVDNLLIPPYLQGAKNVVDSFKHTPVLSQFFSSWNSVVNQFTGQNWMQYVENAEALSPLYSLYYDTTDNIFTAYSFGSLYGIANNAIKMQNAKCDYLGCLLAAYKIHGSVKECNRELEVAEYRYDPTMSQAGGWGGILYYGLLGTLLNVGLYDTSSEVPNKYDVTIWNLLLDLPGLGLGKAERLHVLGNYFGFLTQYSDWWKLQGVQAGTDFAKNWIDDLLNKKLLKGTGASFNGNIFSSVTSWAEKSLTNLAAKNSLGGAIPGGANACPLGTVDSMHLSKYSLAVFASPLLWSTGYEGIKLLLTNQGFNWSKVFEDYGDYLIHWGDTASSGAISTAMNLFSRCSSDDINACFDEAALCPYTEKYNTFSDFAKAYFGGNP